MNFDILSGINGPADVKKLNKADVNKLCTEIRAKIISTVSENGGHLASNLGTVELTVALHRAFDSPDDAIIFDVGHQCYTHKLLTGRFSDFDTLRKKGGISGFLRPNESVHDVFISGHASNSISAAYGIFKAKKIKGEKGTAVAVIGDGAMTGGLAYEALNNAGATNGNFIVVLNDNKMSISKSVGSFSKSLTRLRNKPKYHKIKFAFSKFLMKIPLFGSYLYRLFFSVKEALKGIVYKHNIFECMGFNYLGPVDGHDVEAMESLFEIAKNYDRPSIVHVLTVKGKGYHFAEKKPGNYHGVSSFDIDKGTKSGSKDNFSAVAGNTLCRLAKNDKNICVVTAAMTEGTGFATFAQSFKDRFFDVGIAEEHAVTFCAGLAKGGLKPFFPVYSTFLQRGYDQLIHDCAIMKLPVRFLIDRAGIVGEDGETHQGVFDISFLTSVPGMTVYSPSDYRELEFTLNRLSVVDALVSVRYPRGCEQSCAEVDFSRDFSVLNDGYDKAIITYGRLFAEASDAIGEGLKAAVIKLNKVFPFAEEFAEYLLKYSEIHIFEETVRNGCIGEHLSGLLIGKGYKGKFVMHTLDNSFIPACNVKEALHSLGLDKAAMLDAVKDS